MAQAQWGVDGYGSMKGLIRLRSSPQPANPSASDDDDEGNSSGSDVEEHVEVERRLDHDLSRFEMVYPATGEDPGGYVFEDDDEYDQDAHVARLEEENLTLKERLYLMEQEVGDMRRRLEALEARFSLSDAVGGSGGGGENAVEEAPENDAGSEDNVERAHEGSDKSGEKNAEKGVVDSEDIGENNAEKGAVDAEKHNAEKAAVYSEKKHNAEKVAVDSEKKHNAENGAVDLEKTHNAENGAVDPEKTHNAENGAVDSEKTHNAENGAVDSEKSGQHNTEMDDSVLENTIVEE
uniref:Uncharacterized protein n=1 Tax=Arundo donax TaxID=35708 RepID=A0A0A9EU91_ARUDO